MAKRETRLDLSALPDCPLMLDAAGATAFVSLPLDGFLSAVALGELPPPRRSRGRPGAAMKITLTGVYDKQTKLACGTVRTYYYHRATNTRLLDDTGSAAFVARVQSLNAGPAKTVMADETVGALMTRLSIGAHVWMPIIPVAGALLRSDQQETKKKRGAVAAPRRLLAHARRRRRMDEAGPIDWRGKPVAEIDTAFHAACRRAEAMAARRGIVLDLGDVSPHTLMHASVCCFFACGGRLEDALSYFATSSRTLETIYQKHSPEHQATARAVWERRA